MQSNVAVADSEDQQALAEAVTQLLDRHWPAGTAHKQIGDPGSVSELALWPQLAALGIARLPGAAGPISPSRWRPAVPSSPRPPRSPWRGRSAPSPRSAATGPVAVRPRN